MQDEQYEAITKLTRDLRDAAISLQPDEARYLVDLYYQMQDDRIRSANVVRSTEGEEPNRLLAWMHENQRVLERNVQRAMDAYSMSTGVGQWSRSVVGVGPVIAAGLMAHIDIRKAPTAGHIWRFAGLDPTVRWEKKTKRPWNARLKTLCWKIGESFVKVQGNEHDVYGKVYKERKLHELERNEAGEFAEQASEKLERFKIGKSTDAYGHYSNGRLPPAHIHARAKRYAVKLFLSHWHHVAHFEEFGTDPPKPYVIEHGGHAHFTKPPNWP